MTTVTLDALTVDDRPELPWNEDGVIVVPGLVPEELLHAYEGEWLARAPKPMGWGNPIPYMRHAQLRALCCCGEIADCLQAILGEPAGLHLNLTPWVSTERDWHQDTYLNPPDVGDYYVAAWIALETVDPDAGPFEYVPGSHLWPRVTRELIGHVDGIDLDDADWPKHSEAVLTTLYEQEIIDREAEVRTYLPDRGDVLFWHPRLVHRGARPNVDGAQRKACIAHYSGIHHRPDMPAAELHQLGGWYFPLGPR